jgi:hypothetical protein
MGEGIDPNRNKDHSAAAKKELGTSAGPVQLR